MAGFERWVGKVAIVTGASAGIGADIAKQLVQKGVKVTLVYFRRETKLNLCLFRLWVWPEEKRGWRP